MRVILLLIVTASVCLGQTTWRSAMLRSVSTVAAAAGGGACESSPTFSTTGATSDYLGYSATYAFIGQSGYSQTTNHQICTVGFKLKKSAGDISGITYTVKIFPMSSTSLDTNTLVGASTGVLGTNTWDGTTVILFPFSSPVSLVGGTSYGIVVTPSTISSANYAEAYYSGSGGTVPGGYVRWNSLGAAQVAAADAKDCDCAIYFYR